MIKLTGNIGLKKGDIILKREISPIWDIDTNTFKEVEFLHEFVITRVNKKTYTCQYIKGAFKGTQFYWRKTDELHPSREFYINERSLV